MQLYLQMFSDTVHLTSLGSQSCCLSYNERHRLKYTGVGPAWRDRYSMGKNTCCSCRGNRFGSQHPHNSCHCCNSSSRGSDTLLWYSQALHECGAQTYVHSKHMYEIKINKSHGSEKWYKAPY